jgi:hypothetical protein
VSPVILQNVLAPRGALWPLGMNLAPGGELWPPYGWTFTLGWTHSVKNGGVNKGSSPRGGGANFGPRGEIKIWPQTDRVPATLSSSWWTALSRKTFLPRLVCRGRIWREKANECQTLFNFVQLCSTLFNFVQLCSTMYVQLCSTLFNFVQLCSTLFNDFGNRVSNFLCKR